MVIKYVSDLGEECYKENQRKKKGLIVYGKWTTVIDKIPANVNHTSD